MCLSPRSAPSNLLAGLRRRRGGAGAVASASSWSRIGSRITPGTDDPFGSLVDVVFMWATFPSAGCPARDPAVHQNWTALPSLGTKLSVEIAVRRLPGGALREVASQERWNN